MAKRYVLEQKLEGRGWKGVDGFDTMDDLERRFKSHYLRPGTVRARAKCEYRVRETVYYYTVIA